MNHRTIPVLDVLLTVVRTSDGHNMLRDVLGAEYALHPGAVLQFLREFNYTVQESREPQYIDANDLEATVGEDGKLHFKNVTLELVQIHAWGNVPLQVRVIAPLPPKTMAGAHGKRRNRHAR